MSDSGYCPKDTTGFRARSLQRDGAFEFDALAVFARGRDAHDLRLHLLARCSGGAGLPAFGPPPASAPVHVSQVDGAELRAVGLAPARRVGLPGLSVGQRQMVPAAHLQGVARSEEGAEPVDAVGLRSGDGDEVRDPDPAPHEQAFLPRKIRERREGVGDLDVRLGSRDRARLRDGGQVDPHEGFRIQREAEARHVHGDEGRLVGRPLELIAEGDGVPVDLESGAQPGPDPRRDVHLARFAGTLVGRGRSRRGFIRRGDALRRAFGRDRRRDRARG